MTIYTWAKGSLPKNIGSWMHGNGHVQILLRGAGDNTPHRLKLLIREKSKIVILIYENTPAKNRAITEIIETYKRTFQQESVLRTTSEVKISF